MSRYDPKDRFFRKAKSERYAARSVYKLEEIDRRYRLVRRGMRLIDLGSSPGSWGQYLARAVGRKGRVVGYDLQPPSVHPGPNVHIFVADVAELDGPRILRDMAETNDPVPPGYRIDGVLSDMAPKLTGIRDADQAKSVTLADQALRIAVAIVRPGGFFVAKLFQGRDTDPFLERVRSAFRSVKLNKPEATREGSREVFVVGLERRDVRRTTAN